MPRPTSYAVFCLKKKRVALHLQKTPAAAECARVALRSRLHITMEPFLGEMLSWVKIPPEEDPCWKAISNETTPWTDSVPNQRVDTWTISPRLFIQKVTVCGPRRHTCVRPHIWGYG